MTFFKKIETVNFLLIKKLCFFTPKIMFILKKKNCFVDTKKGLLNSSLHYVFNLIDK
jgi:hypothetical protein